jgi:hypothetical protein
MPSHAQAAREFNVSPAILREHLKARQPAGNGNGSNGNGGNGSAPSLADHSTPAAPAADRFVIDHQSPTSSLRSTRRSRSCAT